MMEMVEWWRFPAWTTASVLLSVVTIAFAQNRTVFLAFLVSTTAYFLIFRFPEVANHINLLLFCNLLLILGLAYSHCSQSGQKEFPAYFETLLSPLRLMLIVTFSVAGFHKFNYDFLNPDVSCIGEFFGTFLWTLTTPLFEQSTIPALTIVLILCGVGALAGFLIGAPVVSRLLPRRLGRSARWMSIGGLALIIGTSLLVAVPIFLMTIAALNERQIEVLVVGIAILVVFWQMAEGPLLLVPRLQAFFLSFALLFHSFLAMIGFVDFQALALALLLAFVPKPVLEAWNHERYAHLGSRSFDRVYAYVGLNLLAGLLTGVQLHVTPLFENISAVQGLLFNVGVLILIWPIIAALLSCTREWRWRGVAVFDSGTPKFLYLFPFLLLLFGMTSYLGLRTAGNFSMFSNLRTEGATSNHILLRKNPLKIWDYQEDSIRILKFDESAPYAEFHYAPRLNEGMGLPVVEFRKLIRKWAKEGMEVPIVFEYQGKVYSSDNIATDPNWRVTRPDWEMSLLDFRVIQPEGPNECRW